MGGRVLFGSIAFVLGFAILAGVAGCTRQPVVPIPVLYYNVWNEMGAQEDIRQQCVAAVIEQAPKDSSASELDLLMFSCLHQQGLPTL